MKRILFTFVMALAFMAAGATDYRPENYSYSMEYTGVGRNETVLVTVTFMCGSPSEAESLAKTMAVHGVLFLENAPHPGAPEQNALVSPDDMTKEAEKYFDAFFAGGSYGEYVTSVNTSKMEITKANKKQYRIKVQVAVDKHSLRKELENEKIIKSLDHIFKHEN